MIEYRCDRCGEKTDWLWKMYNSHSGYEAAYECRDKSWQVGLCQQCYEHAKIWLSAYRISIEERNKEKTK